MDYSESIDDLAVRLEAFHISTRLQLAPKSPDSVETASKQDGFEPLKDLPFAWNSRLLEPQDGQRPCYEPPIFDYSFFEGLLEAENEVTAREGSTDIEWRRDVMDNMIEALLSKMSPGYAVSQLKSFGEDDGDCGLEVQQRTFWRGLVNEVNKDQRSMRKAWQCAIPHRRGKDREAVNEMKQEVMGVAEENDTEFVLKFAVSMARF